MIKINWPTAILIMFAILIWLARSSAPAQPKPQPAPRARRQPRTNRPHATRAWAGRQPVEPLIIIDQRADGSDHAPDLDRMTYEEALHDPTLTSEQMSAIGDREALAAARRAAEAARTDNPFTHYTPAWRK